MRIALALVAGPMVAAMVVAGCSTSIPVDNALQAPGGVPEECGGVGMAAILRGSPSDPRHAWVEGFVGGAREDVRFPAGYAARFAPGLEVVDPGGTVVMREGDFVYGACVTAEGDTVIDPSASLRLDCGPVSVERCAQAAGQAASSLDGHSNSDVRAVRFTTVQGAFVATLRDGSAVEGAIVIEP